MQVAHLREEISAQATFIDQLEEYANGVEATSGHLKQQVYICT